MVNLRKACTADIKLVRAMLAAAGRDLTVRFGQGHWSKARSIETLRKYASNGTLYVIESRSVAVGTLMLTDRKIGFYKQEWFARPQDTAAYLMDMAIDPDHQRRGIGRQSMELAERLAKLAELHAIRLDAYRGPPGAGPFYKKCGYKLVHRGEINGTPLEYFEKVLPAHISS